MTTLHKTGAYILAFIIAFQTLGAFADFHKGAPEQTAVSAMRLDSSAAAWDQAAFETDKAHEHCCHGGCVSHLISSPYSLQVIAAAQIRPEHPRFYTSPSLFDLFRPPSV